MRIRSLKFKAQVLIPKPRALNHKPCTWVTRVQPSGSPNQRAPSAMSDSSMRVAPKNHGCLVVLDYITAPTIQGYQNGKLILGTTREALRQYSLLLKTRYGSLFFSGLAMLLGPCAGFNGRFHAEV